MHDDSLQDVTSLCEELVEAPALGLFHLQDVSQDGHQLVLQPPAFPDMETVRKGPASAQSRGGNEVTGKAGPPTLPEKPRPGGTGTLTLPIGKEGLAPKVTGGCCPRSLLTGTTGRCWAGCSSTPGAHSPASVCLQWLQLASRW